MGWENKGLVYFNNVVDCLVQLLAYERIHNCEVDLLKHINYQCVQNDVLSTYLFAIPTVKSYFVLYHVGD